MGNPAFPVRIIDWSKVREAFICRPERPTYPELGTEFNVSVDRIKRAASDEGWSALRAAKLESQLKEGDAATAIIRAIRMDSTLMHGFSDLAVDGMARVKECMDQLSSKEAITTKANTLNTLMFAMSNLANALQKVGIVGLPKELKQAADTGNGKWNPQMLAALNVTVQNIVAGKEPMGAMVAYPPESETADVVG